MTCINLPARTGQQFSISHGDYEAVITELGATMRKLTYKGEDLTVALGPDDLVTCCHGRSSFRSRIASRVASTRSKARPIRCRSMSMTATPPSTATDTARSGS